MKLNMSFFILGFSLSAHAQCPWNEATLATEALTDGLQIKAILNKKVPLLIPQLERDAKTPALFDFWGLSNNFDVSHPEQKIVPTPFLQLFSKMLSISYPQDFNSGHAGLNHTYGYLFSNLVTPYGYKRERYTQGEIEAGFGLPPGLLSGCSKKGTLLSNFTHFIGHIAFRDSPDTLQKLKAIFRSHQIESIPEITHYPFQKLKTKRLLEQVETKEYLLELRTDLTPFTQSNLKTKDQALLIYSIDFHPRGAKKNPLLITAFPVTQNFGDSLFNPKNLGEHQTIKLKYNATLPVTIPEAAMVGKSTIAHE